MGEQLAIGRKALPQFCYVKTYVRLPRARHRHQPADETVMIMPFCSRSPSLSFARIFFGTISSITFGLQSPKERVPTLLGWRLNKESVWWLHRSCHIMISCFLLLPATKNSYLARWLVGKVFWRLNFLSILGWGWSRRGSANAKSD